MNPRLAVTDVNHQAASGGRGLKFVESFAPLRQRCLFCQWVFGPRSQSASFLLGLSNELSAVPFLEFAHLHAFKDRTIWISVGTEAPGAGDYVAEALALLYPVGAGVNDFAIDFYSGADVVPARHLAHRENVAGSE